MQGVPLNMGFYRRLNGLNSRIKLSLYTWAFLYILMVMWIPEKKYKHVHRRWHSSNLMTRCIRFQLLQRQYFNFWLNAINVAFAKVGIYFICLLGHPVLFSVFILLYERFKILLLTIWKNDTQRNNIHKKVLEIFIHVKCRFYYIYHLCKTILFSDFYFHNIVFLKK